MAQAAGLVHPSDSGQSSRQDWITIFLVGLAHASSHFFQLVIPSLFVPLSVAFELDFVALGFLMTVFFVISGVGQVISGFLVDSLGARPVLWFGVACFVFSALLVGTATGYPMLMAAAVMGGIGNAVFHPADFSILNHRVNQNRLGHAFSMHNATGTVGWALAPIFVMGLTSAFGWRVAAVGVAVLMSVVLLTLWFGRRLLHVPGTRVSKGSHDADPAASGTTVLATFQKLLSSPALCGAFLFFCCATIALSSVQNYTIPLMESLYGMSSLVAGSVITAYMVGNLAGMLAGGFLVKETGRNEFVVFASLILSALMFWLLASGAVAASLAMVAMSIAGFFAGASTPSRDMLVRKVAPKKAVGSVYGLVYSGLDVGSSLGPLIFGVFWDYGWERAPWLGAGAAFVVGAILAVYIGRASTRTAAA